MSNLSTILGVSLGITIGACSACTTKQGTAAVNTAVDTAVCVINHWGDPPEKIVTECDGVTVADVNRILDAATAMQVRKDAGVKSVQP